MSFIPITVVREYPSKRVLQCELFGLFIICNIWRATLFVIAPILTDVDSVVLQTSLFTIRYLYLCHWQKKIQTKVLMKAYVFSKSDPLLFNL